MRYALILGALLVCGCGSKDECSPGASAACVGSAGCVGTQVCNAEGTAFGACDCGPAWTAPCNVATQEGCPSDKRCGFILVSNTEAKTGCVPIGGAGALEACTNGIPGTTTGFDNCQAGLVCISGECRATCRPRPAQDTCGSGFACVPYGFADSLGNLGACEPTCNPVTQVRDLDQALACGSPNPVSPTRGCYGFAGNQQIPSQFFCAPVAGDRTHRILAEVNLDGVPILNSCAPGYAPLLKMNALDGRPICVAFCSPAEVHSGATAQAQGVSPHTCSARGANPPEECRFFWLLERVRTTYNNTVGFCIDPGLYTYNHDRDETTPEVTMPSCTALANSDMNNDGTPDHLFHGCAPLPL
jgi:hypothetical protein